MRRAGMLFIIPGVVAVLLGSLLVFPESSLAAAKPAPHGQMTGMTAVVNKDIARSRLAAFGDVPLYFIGNQGQTDPEVRYLVKGPGRTLYFTRKGLVAALTREQRRPASKERINRRNWRDRYTGKRAEPRAPAVVSLKPVNLSPNTKLLPLEPQAYKVNYFLGNNPAKWRRDVPTYKALLYWEAYPGVDLKFYGQGRSLEYDIVVKPGADPGQVRFRYEGAKELSVTPAGDLAIVLTDGQMLVQKRPLIYQEIGGQRVAREGRFKVQSQESKVLFGFELASYDHRHPLIIDPVIVFSTCLGGIHTEWLQDIAADQSGNVYVFGETASGDFPMKNPLQATPKASGTLT